MLGLSPADYFSILVIVFLVLYVIWFIKMVVFRINTEELAPASAPTPTRTERAVTIDVVIDISNEAIKTLGIKGENSFIMLVLGHGFMLLVLFLGFYQNTRHALYVALALVLSKV
ncbi:hypothetical protein H5410_059175 [Solanum commersonii]|uniref:Uncharacterized protein n=1 Tax=Solanum commersonii TaxID=4109 RepID=A0A9J5W1X3_SOLCO|nr:hypothetical protein H5410_059175 [Solanum commersonii]